MKIKSEILRTYQSVHTWTGITAGLLLFIGFFAGALTMFKDTINIWATPSYHHLPSIEKSQYDKLVNMVLEKHPDASKGMLVSFKDNTSPVMWEQREESEQRQFINLTAQYWHATLDKEGNLVAELRTMNHLSFFIDYLHRTAGITGEIGHDQAGVYVLGIASFAYFIALVSGTIFLLPTLIKRFFALRGDKGAARLWLDSHNLVGVVSLPFHIIIAFSVIVFAFHDLLYDGLGKIYGDKPMFPFERSKSEIEYSIENLPTVSDYLVAAESKAKGYTVSSITYSSLNSSRPSSRAFLENSNTTQRSPDGDYMMIHPYTLKVNTGSVSSEELVVWGWTVKSFFSLHFGSFGGELGRWGYFFLGLLGAFLFYSGNLLWLEKRRDKKRSTQKRSVDVMAKLTIGVALGAIVGVAATFALTKWLSIVSNNINLAYLYTYYLSFGLSLLISFKLGAPKAAILLLRAATVLCLIAPITSIIALIVPSIGVWAPVVLPAILLEMVLCLFAIVFWRFSVHVNQRAHSGERNSIWFIENRNFEHDELKKGLQSTG